MHPWWKESREEDWIDAGFAGKPAYGHKAVDHYTGLRLAELVGSASEQEYHAYPRLMEKVYPRPFGSSSGRSGSGEGGIRTLGRG